MSIVKDFGDFLQEYKVMGLAVAFIMGAATTTLVKSLVDDIIMPIITVIVPNGSWETATLPIGPIIIKWGYFLSALINFFAIALVVFLLIKSLKKTVIKK